MQTEFSSSSSFNELMENLQNEADFASVFAPAEASFSHAPRFDSSFVMQHQEMINRHALCLKRLREATREAENLLQENAALRSVNRELTEHLSFLIESSKPKQFFDDHEQRRNAALPFDVVTDFRDLCSIGGRQGEEHPSEDESPTSVMEMQSVDTDQRVSLPKSISVRSSGYLKTNQTAGTSKTCVPTRPQTVSPPGGTKKVYIRGGKKEEEPLELEVYNQGMFKTELCNKWQATGTCPYGNHCQFAHGIGELRPVIRHPRYKTEVCRMILTGDSCPYGHRCHFRHTLTEQERFMAAKSSSGTNKLG